MLPELIKLDSAPPRDTHLLQPFTAVASKLLPGLVKHVREYAASGTPKLYYSDSDIRSYIAGLATSRLLILQGLSGTGKTSLPRVFAEAIGAGEKRITVQSNWRDRHELLGYYNDFNKRFSESEFTQAVYRASLPIEEDVPWFIILDEMNLARCEYYFADFLSLLETPNKSDWRAELMSFNPSVGGIVGPRHLEEGRYLRVPGNIWFVGTANQDESTFEITDKVYDRAQMIEFRRRHDEFQVAGRIEAKRVTFNQLERVFESAKHTQAHQMESSHVKFLDELDQFMREKFDIGFGNRIKTQLRDFVPVYVACGGTKEEALDIQIARKILRKLENRHDSATLTFLGDLESVLRTFPTGGQHLRLSLEMVERKKVRSV